MANSKRWFADSDHALHTGFLAGTLKRKGIEYNIIRDELGNYKPFLELVILEPGEIEPIRVTIQVMPGETEGAQDERDEGGHARGSEGDDGAAASYH